MAFDLRNPNRTVHAGVILTKGTTEMIDVAPFEFFSHLREDMAKMMRFPEEMLKDLIDIKLHWVTEDGEVAELRSGAQIKPTDSFESCPPLDIVLMGAHDVAQYKMSDGEKAFIQKSYNDCSAFMSVCGGIWSMLEAGLLEGKTAAVPRPAFDMMKKAAPHVNWVDKRWAHDGKVWSSSTLLNGTDLMRGFAVETWGGRNGLIEAILDLGHWPERDIDFNDFHGSNIAVESF